MLLASRLGGTGKLDGNLALQDLLARKLADGALSLARRGEVDKGVANRAVGTRILGDRDRLTEENVLANRTDQLPLLTCQPLVCLLCDRYHPIS
jgi:hypothetical protein